MVGDYRFFNGSLSSLTYTNEVSFFSTGSILTTKGPLKFYTNTATELPLERQLYLLCRVSEVPGFKIELIATYQLTHNSNIIPPIKHLLKLIADHESCDAKCCVDSVIGSQFEKIRQFISQREYIEWAASSGIAELSLDDYMMHSFFDPVVNDWIVNETDFNISKQRSNNSQSKGQKVGDFFVGPSSLEQLKKLASAISEDQYEVEPDQIRSNMDLDIVQSVLDTISHVFSYSGIYYIPIENFGQRLFLKYLELMGFNAYEIHDFGTVYDLESPCIVYGPSTKRSRFGDLISSFSVLPVTHTSPLSVSLFGIKPQFGCTLDSKVSHFLINERDKDTQCQRIISAFKNEGSLKETGVINPSNPKRFYRGIIIGDESDVIRLSGYCNHSLIWLETKKGP